jgi:hypothetical protein
MPKTISQKLRIQENFMLLTLNAPPGFRKGLTGLPGNVSIKTAARNYNQVHWFVINRAQLEKQMSRVMKLVKKEVVVWVYYPKGSSGLQTDLTRDKGWDCLLSASDKLTWINLISYDDTWSVFGFRAKSDADKKKETKPATREIFDWVDPGTKEVRLPPDLLTSLNKNKKAMDFFNTLSFTNKKEYLEWVVTARRRETRSERISGTVERLNKRWKNPRNM